MRELPNCFYRVSIKGLILDENKRFLLCRESDGRWDLPGGGLDVGEDIIEGLRREIYEEMGLTVTTAATIPSYFFVAEKEHKNFWIANVLYEINVEHYNISPTNECEEIRFFTVEEAKEVPVFENIPEFLKVFDPSNH